MTLTANVKPYSERISCWPHRDPSARVLKVCYGLPPGPDPPPPPPLPEFPQPPDPIFPSITDTDDKLVSELVEGNRSKVQAARVLGELAEACRESAAELEVFLEVR